MKFRISDLIELDELKGAKVAAGSPYVSNRVRSVSVMDARDPERAGVENGVKEQLVLTSFRAADDDNIRVKMVRRLANAGISGLLVFPRENFEGGLSDKLVKEADAMGMPLIVMPKDSPVGYYDIISIVMDQILNGDTREHDLINDTVYYLLDFEKHSSFPEALKEAAINSDFQVVLLSTEFNPILVIETRKRASVADVVRYGMDKEVSKGGEIKFLDVNGLLTYWSPVTVQNEKYFLLIVDNNDNYSAQEIAKLSEIIELAMGMWKYTPERDVRSEFIRALMRNNKSLAYSLRDELDIDPETIISVFYAKGIRASDANDIIAKAEKERGIEVLRLQESDEMNALILKKKKAPVKDLVKYKKACLKLFDDLKGIGKTVRIFHATGLGGVEGAGDAFRLINETWPYVESVFPYKRIFTKFEFALVSDCINLQVNGGYQRKNYMDLLEPFHREVGENKANQLLETLEAFVLDAGMNASKTAEIMGVHANTVQYRLKRINEVLSAEITGNRVIPGLTIALALKRLERVVRK